MPPPRPLPRRAAVGGLAALSLAVVAGCTRSSRSVQRVAPAPTRRAGTNPDVRLAADVLAEERAVLARVKATGHRHPSLAADLASARDAHRAHVRLLARAVPDETSSPSPRAAPEDHPVPAAPGAALAALAAAEDRLSRSVRQGALTAESGPFARVLASMAAAAAQQGYGLAAVARDRP